MPRRNKVSSISLNIPAAGLGSRPPSIISTNTSDEGGFNEPSPKIEAKLKPHEESLYDYPINEDKPLEYTDSNSSPEDPSDGYKEITPSPPTKLTQQEIEALYAVACKKPRNNQSNLTQQKSATSTDSEVSQVTVIQQQKSIDSDVMYNNVPTVIKNSVLAELESQEKSCQNFVQKEKEEEDLQSSNISDSKTKSEPFIFVRQVLQSEDKAGSRTPEESHSEANILDLNDVEYADASDNENNSFCDKNENEAESMTPDEAENLLSTK